MSDEFKSKRDEVVASRSGGRAKLLAGTAFVGMVAVVGYFLLVPDAVDTSGPDTSQTEEMQTREDTSGVDTRMTSNQDDGPPETTPAEASPETQQTTENTEQETTEDDDQDVDDQRIADLEADLEALRQERDDMRTQYQRERAEAEADYQRRLAEITQNVSSGQDTSEAEREARRRLEEERQRRAAIREAQIMSDGIVLDSSGERTGSASGSGGSSTAGAGGSGGAGGAGGAGRTLSSNEAFMEDASTRSYETVRATRIANPGRTIVQGTTLNAVLETAVSTELPGVIRAVVTDDVMSYDGINVLIPKGSRLIGSYNSDVSVVQDRVQIAWNRAVTPDGVSVELGGYGSDALGRSGQAGYVDSRFRERFGSAALISLIGAGPEVVIDREDSAATSDAARDVGDDLSNATRGVAGDYLAAGPVIYIDQGTYMTVFVNRDLVL